MKSLIKQQLFPFFTAYQADLKIEKVKKSILDKDFEFEKSLEIEKALDSLKEFTKDELERKRIIEEKARALLLILTATIVITTGSLNYINQVKSLNPAIVFALLTLSLGFIFFILATINTIKALNVSEYYFILPHDHFHEEEGQVKFFINNESLSNKLYKNLLLNTIINTRRANHLYASFTNIRNGLILIAGFLLLILFSKLTVNEDYNQDTGKTSIPQNFVTPTDSAITSTKETVKELDHGVDTCLIESNVKN